MSDNEQQQFAVKRVYIKDASFESPMGGSIFVENRSLQPKMNIDLNSKNTKISDNIYEVELVVTVTAKLEDEKVLFLAEVHQAGLFLVKGLDSENLRKALAIMAPTLLFPYLRESVDSLVIKGGYSAVNLQPVNFEALYMQAQQQATQQKVQSMESNTH